MARSPGGSVRELDRSSGLQRLPATHWKQLRRVCWPGRPGTLVDHVLVGPSGVYVVRHLPAAGGRLDRPAEHEQRRLRDVGTAACSEYADALGRLLPARYRDRIRPVLRLDGDEEYAEEVRGVLVVSEPTFVHVVRSSPVVLSTSEIDQVHTCLRARLEQLPEVPAASGRRWGTVLRFAAASVAVAAAGAGAFVLGPDASELLPLRG